MQPNILWLDSLRPRGRRNCSPGQQQKHYPGQFHHLRLQKNWKHLPEESVSDPGRRQWQGAGGTALAAWHRGSGGRWSGLRPGGCTRAAGRGSPCVGLMGERGCPASGAAGSLGRIWQKRRGCAARDLQRRVLAASRAIWTWWGFFKCEQYFYIKLVLLTLRQ